jgi:hypothetical protein
MLRIIGYHDVNHDERVRDEEQLYSINLCRGGAMNIIPGL